jgi:hypothetical protein
VGSGGRGRQGTRRSAGSWPSRDGPDRARALLRGLQAAGGANPSRRAERDQRALDPPTCPVCELPFLALAYERAGRSDSVAAVYERYLATPYMPRVLHDQV